MVVKPVYKTSKFFLWRFFDLGIIDGLVNSSAKLMEVFGNQFRRLQTGVIESYAAIFVSGIIFILFWLILR
jgi:NADH:ubiquinone oxidoreductase subunit 5 (subunit L)/multisubunit Na+/H+ antiporter MnhA subunit